MQDAMLQFDASVDLTEHNIPPGMLPAIAVERAREAVGAMTGAGWVSVEWCGGAPAEAGCIRVFKRGAAEPLPGAAGEAVAALLKLTVRKALFPGLAAV